MGMPAAPGSAGDLITACGAKGYTVDFVTCNCVSPKGQEANP